MYVETGRMSVFGGPRDHGVAADEGLALLNHVSDNPHVFLSYQPSGTSGLARRLNPDTYYLAMRWDYHRTPVDFLRKHPVRVSNPHSGAAVFCWPVDWGPNQHTGRIADLSPGTARLLGLNTDDMCEISVPEPSDHAAAVVEPAPLAEPIASPPLPAAPPTSWPTAAAGTSAPHPQVPWPLQRDCMSFYGDPRRSGWLHSHTIDVDCPWPLFCGNTPVHHILIHKRCGDSLQRVLAAVWQQVEQSTDRIKQLHYDQYSGSYNLRVMRGGRALSMHSYACAIDWYDAGNPFHSEHHVFHDDDILIKAFKAEGWIWGGDWGPGSIDAMHVQAARIHD